MRVEITRERAIKITAESVAEAIALELIGGEIISSTPAGEVVRTRRITIDCSILRDEEVEA